MRRVEATVVGCLEAIHELPTDEDHVTWVGHLIEEVERLSFECLVGIFQAIHHNHLVFGCVLGVDLDNRREGLQSEIPNKNVVSTALRGVPRQ